MIDSSPPAGLEDHQGETTPAPARPRQRSAHSKNGGMRALTWVLALIVGLLVLPPLIAVIYSSFREGRTLWEGTFTLENYRDVFGNAYIFNTLFDTLVFAVGTAVCTVFLGTLLAWLVERTDAPFRRIVYGAALVSFGVPTFVQALGWLLLLGPRTGLLNATLTSIFGEGAWQFNVYSMVPMIIIQSITLLPAIFLLLVPSLRATDPSLEEAARMSGASRMQVARRITLRLVAPGVLAAFLLALIIAVDAFEVPATIGTPGRIIVLSTEVYGLIRSPVPAYGAAGAVSTIMMLIAAGGLYLYQRATARSRRFVSVTGKGYRPHRLSLGRWRWLGGVPALILPLGLVAPVGILIWASLFNVYQNPSVEALSQLTLDSYRGVLSNPSVIDSIQNTLILGTITATVVMTITLLASWLLVRRRGRATRSLDFLVTLPLVIPGIVLGLAVIRVFVRLPIPIYGTLAMVLIALSVHYLPYAMRFSHAGIIALHPELEEAASVSGARLLTVFRRIVVPLVIPTVIAGGLFVFLAVARNLSIVVLLKGPNTQVVTTMMWDFWQDGSITDAAAFGVMVVAAIVTLAVVAQVLVKRSKVKADDVTIGQIT